MKYFNPLIYSSLNCSVMALKIVNNLYDKNYLPLNQQEPNLWTKWQNKMELEIQCLQENGKQ